MGEGLGAWSPGSEGGGAGDPQLLKTPKPRVKTAHWEIWSGQSPKAAAPAP